jgi:hypothetical protein
MFAAGTSANGTIIIFNGIRRNILEFDEATETANITGDLPFQNGTSTLGSTTAIPDGKDGIWLFGTSDPKPTNPILHFNTVNRTVSIPPVNRTALPTLYADTAAVWDSQHGYLIGGIGRAQEANGSFHPTNGILRYSLSVLLLLH